MIKVSAQTKFEISIRVSDLFDNLHSFLRIHKHNYTIRIIMRTFIRHRNKYCLNLKEFNCILQPYRCSLSYIKGRSNFQAKDLKNGERRRSKEYGC